MQIDLSNIFLVVVFCVLPYCALVGILLVLSLRARLRYRKQILRDLEVKRENYNPPSIATRRLAAVFVIISLVVLGGLLTIISVAISYYTGVPSINNIDIRTLGVASLIVLLIAIGMVITLIVIYQKMIRTK